MSEILQLLALGKYQVIFSEKIMFEKLFIVDLTVEKYFSLKLFDVNSTFGAVLSK